MIPVHFTGASEIKKPADMTDEECFSVWATRGMITLTDIMKQVEQKTIPPHYAYVDPSISCVCFITAWKPSYEDLQALSRGEPIYIRTISMGGLPPMAVFTLDENGDANDAG